MSCDVGRRGGSDLVLLWWWHRSAATAPIILPAWETPYAMGSAHKRQKEKKKKNINPITLFSPSSGYDINLKYS